MFQKWELVEEARHMICVETNMFGSCRYRVLADVYRKRKIDGTYKYKYVKRVHDKNDE